MFSLILSDNVWLLGFIVVGLTGLSIAIDRIKGKPLWHRNSFNRRTSSSGSPRTLSPDNKSSAKITSRPSHTDVLPPHRRDALANMKIEGLSHREVDEEEVREQILPMTMDYRAGKDEKYTPTGFSVSEIKKLGDFPDYAELSGVPLPQPYPGFNIDKALPRPYRPFRWAYHQTMCMFSLPPSYGLTGVNFDRERKLTDPTYCSTYQIGNRLVD